MTREAALYFVLECASDRLHRLQRVLADLLLPSHKIGLTKGEAVGPSRMDNSSVVNESRGMSSVLTGPKRRMITGNPMAADDVLISTVSINKCDPGLHTHRPSA